MVPPRSANASGSLSGSREVAFRREGFPEAPAILDRARGRLAAEKREPVANLEFVRGDGLARLGRYPEAEAAFRAEIAAFSGNVQAYSRLAVLRSVQHRTRAEVRALMESMYAARPTPQTALRAATTFESFGDEPSAKPWRRRAARGSRASGSARATRQTRPASDERIRRIFQAGKFLPEAPGIGSGETQAGRRQFSADRCRLSY